MAKYLLKTLLIILLVLNCTQCRILETDDQQQKEQENLHKKYFNSIHTFKLEGNTTFGYYYTSLYVGTPPQKQTVIVDTGSYQLAFPCGDCKKNQCGKHIDAPFNFEQSLTTSDFKCSERFGNFQCQNCDVMNQNCNWRISYSEGSSLSGHLMKDYVVFGDVVERYLKKGYKKLDKDFAKYLNHERVYMPFGCTTHETRLFLTQDADGILGLAPSTDSKNHLPNIVDQLYKAHKENDEKHVFSLCLSNKDGGYMSIGGYNRALHRKGEKTHIINYKNTNMYTVNLKNITVNNQDIGVSKGSFSGVIVDSGTTVTLAPWTVVNKMHDSVKNFCKKNRDQNCGGYKKVKFNQSKCYKRDFERYPSEEEFFATFPNIEFQLDDFLFEWEPQNYLFLDTVTKNNKEYYCYAFEAFGSRVLLGGAWMRQYDILFDREHSQLHFTKSDCHAEDIDNNYIQSHHSDIEFTQSDEILYQQLLEQVDKINFPGTQLIANETMRIQQESEEENQDQDKNNNEQVKISDKKEQDEQQLLDQDMNLGDKNDDSPKQDGDDDKNKQEQQVQDDKDKKIIKEDTQKQQQNQNQKELDKKSKEDKDKKDGDQDKQPTDTIYTILMIIFTGIIFIFVIKKLKQFLRSLGEDKSHLHDQEDLDDDEEQQIGDKTVNPMNSKHINQSSFYNPNEMIEIDDKDEDLERDQDDEEYQSQNIQYDSDDDDDQDQDNQQEQQQQDMDGVME